MGITQIYAQSCLQCTGTTAANKATSIGNGTTASGLASFAGGNASDASGTSSFAFGNNANAIGAYSFAFGSNLTSNAANSLVFGQNLYGAGNNSITFGIGGSITKPFVNDKDNSIMFGVCNQPSITIVKPTNGTIGYLGIGTEDPQEMMHVVGKLLIERTSETKSSLQFKHFNTAKGIDPGNPGNPGSNQYYWDIYSDTVGLKFYTVTNSGIQSAYKLNMILSKDGSVGIGVPNPQAKLEVNGAIKATSADIAGTLSVQTLNAQNLAFDGNTIFNGKVGIFTSNPQALLHIHHSTAQTPDKGMDERGNRTLLRLTTVDAPAGLTVTYDNGGIYFRNNEENGAFFIGMNRGGLNIVSNGNVGIGNDNPQVKLDVAGSFKAQNANIIGVLTANKATIPTITGNTNVTETLTANELNGQSAIINGKIRAKEVEVTLSGWWPDYVFENDYPLMNLLEVEQFIKENKHLPDVPSAAEVEANGVNLGEMNAILIQKVEELTLYVLDLQKQINELKTK